MRESPTHAPARREKPGRSKWPRIASEALGCPAGSVLVSSTGVIGMQVDLDPVVRSMPGLVKALRPDGWQDAARAIMTTDTVEKMASAQIELGGKSRHHRRHRQRLRDDRSGYGDPSRIRLYGRRRGPGSPGPLDRASGADGSFNCITVDGDTSTNDSLIVLAGGAAGNQAHNGYQQQREPCFRRGAGRGSP